MDKTTVIVLGASGMLGSMVVDVLSRDETINLIATVRSEELASKCKNLFPQVEWRIFNITDEHAATQKSLKLLGAQQWVVNAIGLTKPYTHDDDPMEIERAIRINALLPYELGHAAAESGGRVLQIATDCVFDGVKGNYLEEDSHNPLDVYGKSKSLGEPLLPNVHCLRCSIIGPEPKVYAFLLEWFRRQTQNGQVNGYTNHQWNGVTTLHFAHLCHGVIKHGIELQHVQHIVPTGTISKAELLQCFARGYEREDITITPTKATKIIDRTLSTTNQTLNRQLWEAAGYQEPPSVPQMVAELARFDYRMALEVQ